MNVEEMLGNNRRNRMTRIMELLDKLVIDYRYEEKDLMLYLLKQKYIICPWTPQQPLPVTDSLDNYKSISLSPEGKLSLRDKDDKNDIYFMYCAHCNKFYIADEETKNDGCPFCKMGGTELFKNCIPGWSSEEQTLLISKDDMDKHESNCDEETVEKIDKIAKPLMEEPVIFIMTPEKLEKIKALRKNYPNMAEVVDYLLQSAVLSQLKKNQEFSFKPFVLVGSPGCGKTAFASELAEIIMGKPACKLDLGNSISNFTITGTDLTYKNARPGLITEALCNDGKAVRNPVIIFDELDKIGQREQYSVISVFYAILEKKNSSRLFENYLSVNIDASGINYIFTANGMEKIPEPILSRLKVFTIQEYTREQMLDSVIESYYENWLKINRMDTWYFPVRLSDYIKNKIADDCTSDARSLEMAFMKVFAESLTDVGEERPVALFSPEELMGDWRSRRGKFSFKFKCKMENLQPEYAICENLPMFVN